MTTVSIYLHAFILFCRNFLLPKISQSTKWCSVVASDWGFIWHLHKWWLSIKAEFFFSFLRDKTNVEKFIAFAGTVQSFQPTIHQVIEAREHVLAYYLSIRAFIYVAFNTKGDSLTWLSKKYNLQANKIRPVKSTVKTKYWANLLD